ncbi:MAG: L-threonylcarbamoyladenylate synthase [Pyrinomonadaceae bacterium]
MILKDNLDTRRHAAKLIAAGGIVAFRTDTFYGLGANPFDERALSSLSELKRREGKPILVIISDPEEAERFIVDKSSVFETVAARHWPGALTLVMPARAEISALLTAGTKTIGVRLPFDEPVREFVRACGGALTATSANLPNEPPARTALEVARSFPHDLSLIVDGGDARVDQPSTVLDVSRRPPRLIREGVVSRRALVETLNLIGEELEDQQ